MPSKPLTEVEPVRAERMQKGARARSGREPEARQAAPRSDDPFADEDVDPDATRFTAAALPPPDPELAAMPRPSKAPPKPLVRRRPPKATVAQTTVTQRLWRNEPTVLIPAVDEDEPPPQKPDEPAPNTRLQQKRERKDQRVVLAAKAAVATLAVLIFAATGAAWGMKAWYDSKFTEVKALDEQSKDIKHKAAQLGDENFLIVGSDTRAGAPKGAGIGSEETIKGARSDTLMIAHLPKDRKRAIMVSFPRDLEITRPECRRWDYKTGEYGKELLPETPQVKLNTAYAEGGPKCVIKWVQKQTGMRMNHFVGIDFAGFKGMVDAVGGVEVNVDAPIIDSILGTVVEKPGRTKLNGDSALSFVRARHVAGDPTSDYGRIKRQQQFIAALLSKTMSKDVLLDPSKLTGFVNAFANSTFGDNVGVDQMLELASSLKGLNADSVVFLTVPTTGYANDRGNEVLLEEQAAELFAAVIHNKPIPGVDDEKQDTDSGKQRSKTSEGNDGESVEGQQAGAP